MIDPILKTISRHLPPVMEESNLVEEITIDDLAKKITAEHDRMATNGIMAVVDRFFSTLCLIDGKERKKGKWRFRSYPAWLMARSILESLSSDGQTIFDPDYWSYGGSEADVDQQRNLLMSLESGRSRFHPDSDAKPIRFVYVAWALIKLDGKFLLYKREDKDRPDSLGRYGLPGGRFRIGDAPSGMRDDPQLLHDAAYGETHWPVEHLMKTLVRELEEELGVTTSDYKVTSVRDVPPYRAVYGPRNQCALTEYHIRLFQIELTHRGLLTLLERIVSTDSYSLFTAEEMIRGKNSAGDLAYIDALGSVLSSAADYRNIPESYLDRVVFDKTDIGVDIPCQPELPLTYGKTGKNLREVQPNLNADEHAWLLALAWHAKGLRFNVENKSQSQRLELYGWAKINISEYPTIKIMMDKIKRAGLDIIEMVDDKYVRMSVQKKYIYFSNNSYCYTTHRHQHKMIIIIRCSCDGLNTPLGRIAIEDRSIPISSNVSDIVQQAMGILEGQKSSESTDRMIREEIDSVAKSIGVRKFISGEHAACNYTISIKHQNYNSAYAESL